MKKNRPTNKLNDIKKTTNTFISILLGSMNPQNEQTGKKGEPKCLYL